MCISAGRNVLQQLVWWRWCESRLLLQRRLSATCKTSIILSAPEITELLFMIPAVMIMSLRAFKPLRAACFITPLNHQNLRCPLLSVPSLTAELGRLDPGPGPFPSDCVSTGTRHASLGSYVLRQTWEKIGNLSSLATCSCRACAAAACGRNWGTCGQ